MDNADIPNFKSAEEESNYWKQKAVLLQEKVEELEQELIDFQENSSQLEKELEKSLEQADRANRDLRTKCNRLTSELDLYREKFEQHCSQSSKQISDLQDEISNYRQSEERLKRHIRELEQKNDDLERSERVMIESLGNIEAKLNSAIERNALLENELDEKEMLKGMVQRLKDEQRDMQEELNRQKRHSIPDNDKYKECVRSPVISNKLALDPQTTPSLKINPNVGQLPTTNRISAINLVGDLLKRVGSLESKLAAPKASRDMNESPVRDLYRTRNQRINRGTSSPTFQSNIVKM